MEKVLTEKTLDILIKIQALSQTIFTAKDIGAAGSIMTSLYKKGFVKRENDKSPYKYSYTGKEYIPPIKIFVENNSNGYTKHNKSNNQYFAEYMEKAVCAIINKEEIINDTGFPFTEKDIELMNEQAHHWVKTDFPYAKTAQYLGRKTITADCDIIINETEHVELKYVSEGNGTYLNTSIYYFTQFGFNFHDYMEKFNYLDLLKEIFGEKVKVNDNSPVSEKVSHDFRKEHEDIYKNIIIPADKNVRKAFVYDLIKYFEQPDHYDELQIFGHQMLTKETPTSQKRNPHYISVYGYKDNIVRRIYPEKILKPNEPITITHGETLNRNKETLFYIKLNNVLRVQIGWQNGTGLNNPTIRVFVEKE